MHEVENMFYVREVPWHGLGENLDNPPTIEEGIRAAGLDWTADPQPLYLANGDVVKQRAIVRSDNNAVLGFVGSNWTPLQNVDAFKFFQPFLDANECTLECAGSLREGKRVFVLAKIKRDPIEVVKGDEFLQYLLLANGHDGSLAVSVALTPIRVVCANTLAYSLSDNRSKIMRCVHSSKVGENLELVRDTINLVTREFEATAEQYRLLASRQINAVNLRALVKEVFFPPKRRGKKSLEVEAKEARHAEKLYQKIEPLFVKGRGNDLPGVAGTYWAGYNAIAEHLIYDRGKSNDIRTDSLWFGQGGTFNKRALDIALSMASNA